MLYRGYWIEFVDLTYANLSENPPELFDPVFLIRRRHSAEILAEAHSISQALALIRDIITDEANQLILQMGGAL